MKVLLVLNDPPYGSERAYNGLRLALALSRQEDVELRIFLIGDAVSCAVAGQRPPSGYYNLARMVEGLNREKVPVGVCGSCREARGIADERLVKGAHGSSMEELVTWTRWAEKILVF